MTAHPRVRRPCPVCGRQRVKITRKARRYVEHTVALWWGAPRCSASGTRYQPPTTTQEDRAA